MTTGEKSRMGTLKRALMDAKCPPTVTATKPCGKAKAKTQGEQVVAAEPQSRTVKYS